ncbi:40S ribosomal protein [Mycena venus]|uniref:40S ribosomal protein n=1 Tax=Mycena venus TaxID=2733690 RepID=A0A8H7D545_9AGAR|nr:40S ribosomal protein [Mycena venus]
MSATTLPKDISKLGQEIKLFGKWDTQDVEVKDISLTDYIQTRNAVYLPHTAGRYAKKQFKKAQMPIVERLVDSLMMKGRNNGKKLLAVRIVAHAFEIIHLLTDQNPIQVLVDAIVNTGPREDSTRIGSQGNRPPAGGRRFAPPTCQPVHLPADHRYPRIRIPQRKVDRGVPRGRAHQRRKGFIQLVRHQEKRRARACRQIQSVNASPRFPRLWCLWD